MKSTHFLCVLSGAVVLSGAEVRLRVIGDDSRPIAAASALVGFAGLVAKDDVERTGSTDAAGLFTARGNALASIYLRVNKPGYYGTDQRSLAPNQDHVATVVLRKIIQPIPLYALRVTFGRFSPENPQTELKAVESYGYDLAVGDLMPPFGKGRTADIVFQVTSEFVGWRGGDRELEDLRRHPALRGSSVDRLRMVYGKWRSRMEIGFASPGAGLVEVRSEFLPHSELKMPHQAPVEGYEPTRSFRTDPQTSLAVDPHLWSKGYFLRTRVTLDDAGRVRSANYAKVMGDFFLTATGHVIFTYWFNPVPNDRNLEFDLARNLFPREMRGSNVHAR